jgi:uncharacterized Zn finger protein (UPF0148 family)
MTNHACPQCGAAIRDADAASQCSACGHLLAASGPEGAAPREPGEPRALIWILVGVGIFSVLASLGGLVFCWIHESLDAKVREQANVNAERPFRIEEKDVAIKDRGVFRDKEKAMRVTDRLAALAGGAYRTNSHVDFNEEISYLVRFEANHVYRIDMRSNQLDSYLEVLDRFGLILASDDDSGGNLNARIHFHCRQSEQYRVRVRDLSRRAGPFELEIQDESSNETPTPIMLVNGSFQTTARVEANDRIDPRRKTPRKLYTIHLQANHRYVMDLESTFFDTYLRLEDAGGVELAGNDDGGLGTNSRLLYTPLQNGLCRIVVTSCAGGAGEFKLTIRDQNITAPNKSAIIKPRTPLGAIAVTELLGNEQVLFVVWTPDAESFAVLESGGALRRIRAKDFVEDRRSTGLDNTTVALAYSGRGILAYQSSSQQLTVIDPQSLEVKQRLKVPALARSGAVLSAPDVDFALVPTLGPRYDDEIH